MNSTLFDFLAVPMGKLLKLLYEFLHNANVPGSYGIAIILFTFVVRSILLPLYIKQFEASSKLAEIAPKLQEIQQKYQNNQEKMQEEILKLYQESNYNPANGCLPILIQIPILFSLYYVFQNPLVYVLGKSHEYVKSLLGNVDANEATIKIIQQAQQLGLDMQFFGINLAQRESIILPILSALSSLLSIIYSFKSEYKFRNITQQHNHNNQQITQMNESMNKVLLLISPFMSYFISIQVPAGLVLYWIVTNIFSIIQQVIVNEVVYKRKIKGERKILKNKTREFST